MAKAPSVEKSLNLAKQAVKKRDWLTAQQLYMSVLDRFPGNKKAATALATIRPNATAALWETARQLHREEKWDEASQHLEAAVYLTPDHSDLLLDLATVYVESNRAQAALEVCDGLIQEQPGLARAHLLRGQALHELDRGAEAKTALENVLSISPDDPMAYQYLGMVEQSGGDLDAARRQFETGLKKDPHNISLLRWIATLKSSVSEDDPHLSHARQALAKQGDQGAAAAMLHFALFDMLHKGKQPREAFSHLKRGNDIIAKMHPFDFKSEAIAGAYAKTLIPEPLSEMSGTEDAKFIFVTGLPRTGTTLTERILSCDDQVQACGELNVIRKAVFEQLNQLRNTAAKRLGTDHIKAFRERVLNEFSNISNGKSIAVDKMPLNFRWIGFICAALPEARIVHMNRDPCAVAWSLYRQVFKGRGHDFIFTFNDIAKFMVYHRDMMSHWRKVCGHRVFDLNYTDLVNDQRNATQALAGAVGLEWSESWLSPEKAVNHVRTASVAQVTKPIYKDSDSSWQAYEAELVPMIRALETAKLL